MVRSTISFFVVLALAGCAAPRNYSTQGVHAAYGGGREFQTLTNLHPDEIRSRLYSVNYQQPGLIPLCTRVRIEAITTIDMQLTVIDTGRRYHYIFHRSMREPLLRHLERYFGTCGEQQQMAGLSEEDMWGIRNGKVKPGMSRRAVILAIGHPPDHATPSLAVDTWRYWSNRLKTFLVEFEGDKVVRIGPKAPDRTEPVPAGPEE